METRVWEERPKGLSHDCNRSLCSHATSQPDGFLFDVAALYIQRTRLPSSVDAATHVKHVNGLKMVERRNESSRLFPVFFNRFLKMRTLTLCTHIFRKAIWIPPPQPPINQLSGQFLVYYTTLHKKWLQRPFVPRSLETCCIWYIYIYYNPSHPLWLSVSAIAKRWFIVPQVKNTAGLFQKDLRCND